MIVTENLLEWACDNLKIIGRGSAAIVFNHPDDDTLVVRVSDYPDGWFLYAHQTLQMAAADEKYVFRPEVKSIIEHDGVWLGVGEKLKPIDDQSEMGDIVENLIETIQGNKDLWPGIEKHVPGFHEFLRTLNKRLDLRLSNFMMRGTQLVFNDPYSSIPFEIEHLLRSAYSVESSDIANLTPARLLEKLSSNQERTMREVNEEIPTKSY